MYFLLGILLYNLVAFITMVVVMKIKFFGRDDTSAAIFSVLWPISLPIVLIYAIISIMTRLARLTANTLGGK